MALLRRKTKDQELEDGAHFEPDWDVPAVFNFTRDVIEEHGKDLLKPALTFVDGEGIVDRRTFREVAGDAARWAHLLRTRVDRGDRVALALGNVPSWHLAMLGALKSGVVAVPCSDGLRARDLAFRVHHSGARLVVANRSLEVEIEEMRNQVGASVSVIYLDEALDELRRYMPVAPSEDTTANETALILYTSGTTQEPKGAVHTHAYTWAQRTLATHWLDAHEGDVVWCTAGTGSAKAVWSSLLGPWSNGAEVVVHESPFDEKERLSLIQRLGVTILCQTPTEYRMLAKLEKLEFAHLPRLRHAVSAGEPLNPEVIARFQDALGLTVYDGYGQTENSLLVASTPSAPLRPGSMGQPTPGHDVAVIDEAGNVCPAGVEGDLALMGRPPTLFSGYWEAPEETDALFRDDWFLTGDRATRDADGYLWFVGRSDDVIVSGGYRIGPFEVESALLEHPAVAESGVVGVPDVDRGQIVHAFVVLRPGQEPSDRLVVELQEHVKAVTAPYKHPREIAFVDELPKTASGKIQRSELRRLHKELTAAPPPALSVVPDIEDAPDPVAVEAAERARREAEVAARLEAVERTRLASAAAAERASQRAQGRTHPMPDAAERSDAEDAAAAAREAQAAAERARLEAEAQARAEAEAAEQAGIEAEARARAEAEEAARLAAEAEAAEQARVESEERARADAEEAARREADERARAEAEAAERAGIEAEERARAEAEEAARQEAEKAARLAAEAEAAERARADAEERTRVEAEEAARREAEERARAEAEERARVEAEERARVEADERARADAEEAARLAAEAEAAERARAAAEAEEAARREAEEAAERERIEADQRARAEAEEAARLAGEAEAAERARAEAAERDRIEAEEAARREAEEAARREQEAAAVAALAVAPEPLEELDEGDASLEVQKESRGDARRRRREEKDAEKQRLEEERRRAQAAEEQRKRDEAASREEEKRRAAEEKEAAKRNEIEARETAKREAEDAKRRAAEEKEAAKRNEIEAKETAKREAEDAKRREIEAKEAAKQQAEEARVQAKLDAEQRKRDEAAAREAEKVAAKQRQEDERRQQAEAKLRAEEERRRQRAEEKAQRASGFGRLFKQEEHDEYDMEADDETPVEPIPDIVERLKFYSRDPGPPVASPNGSDETPVEDHGSPSRTVDTD